MITEAFEAFKKGMFIHERTIMSVEELDYAYKTSGVDGIVKWMIENMDELAFATYNKPFFYAMAYAGIGEKEKAFEWLEEAYEVRSYFMTTIGVEPSLDDLRSDPRFDELLEKIGLK
jgi:hypothetical protein